MDTRSTQCAVQSIGAVWTDQIDGHSKVSHVGDVEATAVAHGSNGQGKRSAHGGGFHWRELTVFLPSFQTLFRQRPKVVGADGSSLGLQGSEVGDRKVPPGAGL